MAVAFPGSPVPAPAPAPAVVDPAAAAGVDPAAAAGVDPAPASDHEGICLLTHVSFQSSSDTYSQCRLLSAQGLDAEEGNLKGETVKGKPWLKNLIIETKEAKIALQKHIVDTGFNEEKITLLARIMLQEQILREMYHRSNDVTFVEARFIRCSSLGELNNDDENLGVIGAPVKKVLNDVKLQISSLISNESLKERLIGSKVRLSVGAGPPKTSVEEKLFFDKFTTRKNEEKFNPNFRNHGVFVFMQEKGDSRHDADPMKPSKLKTGYKYSRRLVQLLVCPFKVAYNKVRSKDKTLLGILDPRGRFPTDEKRIGALKQRFQEFFRHFEG